jgi:exodeoxyribonuclease V alpha subunit
VQLQRNLLYTAITRAKTKVVMLGDWSSVVKAVSNNEVTRRNTQFAKRLRDLVG